MTNLAHDASPRHLGALPAWPHARTTVGVVRVSERLMVDAPGAHGTEPERAPAVRTTAHRGALPFPGFTPHRVQLDTDRARALLTTPFLAGETPELPGTGLTFDDLPGMRRLEHRGFWNAGLAFGPEGRRAAAIEVHEDGAHLVTLDLATGARRYVTAVPGRPGDARPLWSPDGRWILLSSHEGNLLVDPTERTCVRLPLDLPLAAATWWPQRGDSTLMLLHGRPGAQRVTALDLATWTRTPVSRLDLGAAAPGDAEPGAVWGPVMSPDGDRVLVGDTRGTPAHYRHTYGTAQRLAVLDPRTGGVVRLAPPFRPGTTVENVHEDWSWSAPQRPGAPVRLHPALVERLSPTDLTGRGNEPRARVTSLWLWEPRTARRPRRRAPHGTVATGTGLRVAR